MDTEQQKRAITDTLTRYMFAVDSGDAELLRSCYTPDAQIGFGTQMGLDAFIAVAMGTQVHVNSHHMLMNSLIQVNGTEATAFSYMLVYTQIPGHCAEPLISEIFGSFEEDTGMVSGGYYRDKLIFDGDAWKIKNRELQILWKHTLKLEHEIPIEWLQGPI